jgi:hypothetical protein
LQRQLEYKRQMKTRHQLEDETKMLQQTAVSSLFKEIKNARAHINTEQNSEDQLFSSRMAGALEVYLHKEGKTPELQKLREVAEKVKEELWDIEDGERDITPTRMEFIDYRREYKKKEKNQKIHEDAKTFKFKENVVRGLT